MFDGATRQCDLCILLPVLNEIENIEPLLQRIDAALAGRRYLVCLVDDGSTDGTREYLEAEAGRHPDRLHLIKRMKTVRGSQRGGALHAAMMWSLENTTADIFVEMDGDLSHRPEELPAGIDRIASGRVDVAIASKYLRGSRVTNRPFGRRLVSRLCNVGVRLLLSLAVRDYSNGYRFYRRAAALAIAETRIRFTSPIYLTEAMGIWLSRSLRIGEFPSHYVGRNEGLSKLRLIDLVKASLAIFHVALRLHVFGFKRAEPCGTQVVKRAAQSAEA